MLYSLEFKFDRTNFPLIRMDGWDFYISLFPVSKYQFEEFMIEMGPRGGLYTDKWYREILSLNPRQTWREIKKNRWRLFLTGLSYAEIEPFLLFLGDDFRIPKKEEWIKLHRLSSVLRSQKELIKSKVCGVVPEPVLFWIEEGIFPLTEEGILEMVEDNGRIRFIGKPFKEFYPNLWNPKDVRDINWEIAKKYVGFRVVKDG